MSNVKRHTRFCCPTVEPVGRAGAVWFKHENLRGAIHDFKSIRHCTPFGVQIVHNPVGLGTLGTRVGARHSEELGMDAPSTRECIAGAAPFDCERRVDTCV